MTHYGSSTLSSYHLRMAGAFTFFLLFMAPMLFNLRRVHHMKCQAGWSTSWNQDSQEKYQQSQICRWYHSNGRKWKGTKEPLDEGERGEQKSCLEIQHSVNKDHGIWSHHFMTNRENWKLWQTLFSWAPKSLQTVTAGTKLKDPCSLEGKLWQT